jgi:hypothetical protein
MLIKNIGRFSWSHKYALSADIIVPKKNNWELRIVPKPLRGGKAQLYFPALVEAASGKIQPEEKQAAPGRVLIN